MMLCWQGKAKVKVTQPLYVHLLHFSFSICVVLKTGCTSLRFKYNNKNRKKNAMREGKPVNIFNIIHFYYHIANTNALQLNEYAVAVAVALMAVLLMQLQLQLPCRLYVYGNKTQNNATHILIVNAMKCDSSQTGRRGEYWKLQLEGKVWTALNRFKQIIIIFMFMNENSFMKFIIFHFLFQNSKLICMAECECESSPLASLYVMLHPRYEINSYFIYAEVLHCEHMMKSWWWW